MIAPIRVDNETDYEFLEAHGVDTSRHRALTTKLDKIGKLEREIIYSDIVKKC